MPFCQCEVCGDAYAPDLLTICPYCCLSMCDVCYDTQGEEGQGHEEAEHGNERRFDPRRPYDAEDGDDN